MAVLPWIAIIFVVLGIWIQAIRNFWTKNVEGLSFTAYLFLAIGLTVLAFQAYSEGSAIFLTRQLVTLVPVVIVCWQILCYKK